LPIFTTEYHQGTSVSHLIVNVTDSGTDRVGLLSILRMETSSYSALFRVSHGLGILLLWENIRGCIQKFPDWVN